MGWMTINLGNANLIFAIISEYGICIKLVICSLDECCACLPQPTSLDIYSHCPVAFNLGLGEKCEQTDKIVVKRGDVCADEFEELKTR